MPKCLRRWELHILRQFPGSTFNMAPALRAFPGVGFIVANLETDSGAGVRFYMTRLSWHRFRSNEVRRPLT